MPSEMNQSLHKVIVQSILEISKGHFQTSLPSVPRGFMCTLDTILSDLRDQIIFGSTDLLPDLMLEGRRPETLVVNSWLNWHENRLDVRLFWVSCSFQKTTDFVEKVFQDPAVSRVSCLHNITWGTFLRHLRFIGKNSEGWIPSIVEGECGWEEHSWNVKNHLIQVVQCVGHPVSNQEEPAPEYWTKKFNKEESDKVIGMNSDGRFKLGYLVSASEPAPVSASEPAPEPTQTDIDNDSLKKIQEIIEAAAEKSEINEGEYLQLSKSLLGLYVSQ